MPLSVIQVGEGFLDDEFLTQKLDQSIDDFQDCMSDNNLIVL